MRMILQIIISNGILDLVTGILAKISLGTGIWAKFRLGTGIRYPPSRPSLKYLQYLNLSYPAADLEKEYKPFSLFSYRQKKEQCTF